MRTGSLGSATALRFCLAIGSVLVALLAVWICHIDAWAGPGGNKAGGNNNAAASKKSKRSKKSDKSKKSAKDKKDHSDLDRDGDVDLDDLRLFAERRVEEDWDQVDWTTWIDENSRWDKHYYRLFAFIREYFSLDTATDPLRVVHGLMRPTRLAIDTEYRMFVTDPGAGAVFFLDGDRQITAELRGFEAPLGIAVDGSHRIYVGEDVRDCVEVYDTSGRKLLSIGETLIRKPVDLDIGPDGNLYVADAEASVVWVFDLAGRHLRTIRKGMLGQPIAVDVAVRTDSAGVDVTEVYVLDKSDYCVKVYDTDGKFLRYFGGFPDKSGWWNVTWDWEGKFVSPQSVFLDPDGKLHVLDVYLMNVQVLDAVDGAYVEDYGTVGNGLGEFRLPLDIERTELGKVLVTDADLSRVEVIR